MTATYSQATDEIFSQFFQSWINGAEAICGYVPQIEWQNLQAEERPDTSKFWVRISKQTVIEQQATLSDEEGEPGQKRYTASGLVFVQIFAPKSYGAASQKLALLAELAQSAYRGKNTSSGIWFRNVRIQELPSEELFFRANVIAEYEYDCLA